MLADPKVKEILEKMERERKEREEKYEPLSPFLCGVCRSMNVRVYDPKSRIPPYTER